MKELMTREMKKEAEARKEKPATVAAKCPCGKEDNNDMIGCDSESCPYKWPHLRCAGLGAKR